MIPSDTLIGQYLQMLCLLFTRFIVPAFVVTYVAGQITGRFFYRTVRPFTINRVKPALVYAFTIN